MNYFCIWGKGDGVHNLFTVTSHCEQVPTQHFAFTWYFSFLCCCIDFHLLLSHSIKE